jgi:hypothetical protein
MSTDARVMCRRSFTRILSDVTLDTAATFTSLGALPGFGALLSHGTSQVGCRVEIPKKWTAAGEAVT